MSGHAVASHSVATGAGHPVRNNPDGIVPFFASAPVTSGVSGWGTRPDAGGADATRAPSALIASVMASGGRSRRGGPARLRDRYLVEFLMAPPRERRHPHRWTKHTLRVTVRDVAHWSGWDSATYRPSGTHSGVAMERALREVTMVTMPWGSDGGWVRPVAVVAVEGRRMSDTIGAVVTLPPRSNVGARVALDVLRVAGATSAIAWRLYLAICFDWATIAVRGRMPHTTRPRLLRDAAGYLLDAGGRIITDARGRPQRDGRHARAVETSVRERSPAARLYRVWRSGHDLAALAHPEGFTSAMAHPARTSAACVRAIRWLAGEDGVELHGRCVPRSGLRIERDGLASERNPHGFPWRLHPPFVR